MRILVVEDNPDDRALELHEINALFPEAEVVEIIDPATFDAALSRGQPDLVVTDLDLRWTTGHEVLLAVKSRYPACPVVMFTGTGDETVAVELMKAGLDDYVVKSPRQLPRLRISLRIAVEMAMNRAALSDREVLLTRALARQHAVSRELHHRVRNNLQTISCLLRSRNRSLSAETCLYLDEVAGRLEALGAVQSRIYESHDLDDVDFSAALVDIAASLVKLHHGDAVTLDSSGAGPLMLGVGRAMPLALVTYEIILNAMKYAWPKGQRGRLGLVIARVGGACEIAISDDGVGVGGAGVGGDDAERALGSGLIASLAEEAGARYRLVTNRGTGTTVTLTLD